VGALTPIGFREWLKALFYNGYYDGILVAAIAGHPQRNRWRCSMAYIEFDKVVKEYPSGGTSIRALDEASFTADQGELTVILGQSGAGKTTALNILGGMDTATSGRVVVGERDITGLRKRDLITYRRNDVGFVFQFYNLVPNLTALENVELASQICPDHFDPAETLRKVGLGERMNNFPGQLSGGEQQRVSIARAIAKKPKLLLCDEPTGALDYETGKEVLQLLQDICRDEGMTVMIITHNSALAPMAHKVIHFRSGTVTSEEINTAPQPIADIEW
jgi:putative ABC transport system ATP-binding protein